MTETNSLDQRTLKSLLETATHAAQGAGPRILQFFRQAELEVERKGDGSPVTLADKEAESFIREQLKANTIAGELDILGEEQGLQGKGTRWRWLIDPIDGTRSFIHGIPLFGTIIALENTTPRRAEIGVIHLPALGLTYAAGRGLGATCNGQRVRVSQNVELASTIIAVGDPAQFASAQDCASYKALVELCPYVRGYADCFGHAMVVSGAVGAMLDPALNLWDVMATQVLVEEAGGRMRLRPSAVPHKVDALFGSPLLVDVLDRELAFSRECSA